MNGKKSRRDDISPGDPGYNAMQFCRVVNVAAVVLCGVLLFYPWQGVGIVLALACVPLLAIAGAFASGGEITLGAKAGTLDTRPTAVWALWLPALAVALHAYGSGPNLLQPKDVLWAGGAGGALVLMFILLADPIVRYSVPRAVPLALPAFLLAAGLAAPLDVVADGLPPLLTTSAQVLSRHVSTVHGTAYVLGLSAWGPVEAPSEARVPATVYGRAAVGELVCVSLHGGALGIKWYDVATCS